MSTLPTPHLDHAAKHLERSSFAAKGEELSDKREHARRLLELASATGHLDGILSSLAAMRDDVNGASRAVSPPTPHRSAQVDEVRRMLAQGS